MQLLLDCLPCLLRQVLEAARMATDDEAVHETVMDEAVELLAGHAGFGTAPALCEAMHAIVKKHTGLDDPYRETKDRDIAAALRLEPMLGRFASEGGDEESLVRTLKIAATGNVMDSALYGSVDIEACATAELERPFALCDADSFAADLARAERVVVIGDNAGETVFDKVLVRRLAASSTVTYAVRERPIINDSTVADAHAAGIDDVVDVISTGCGAPGAILESCSAEFRELFDRADVVISKGQGNFEALSGTSRTVYFLLKAKCPKISQALGVGVGEYVFTAGGGGA